MSSYAAYLTETFVALACVCTLAVAILWIARRGGTRGSGPVELYGHLQLEARRAIYLVKVGAQVFVIGAAEGGLTKLGEIPTKDLARVEPLRATPFREFLARAVGRSTDRTPLAEAGRAPSPEKPEAIR